MRSAFPNPSVEEALVAFERMLRAQEGLRLLLSNLPEGSTLEDARLLHERLTQKDRRPCTFLDRDLGILRD